MKISMFDKNAWRYASGDGDKSNPDNGYGQVIIRKSDILTSYSQYKDTTLNNSGELTEVRGALQSPLSLDYKSEWVNMSSMSLPSDLSGVGSLLSNGIQLAGGGQAGAQYTERLIWAKSGRLDLKLDIVFIDWEEDDNSPSPLDKLKQLVKYTLSAGSVFRDVTQAAVDATAPTLGAAKELVLNGIRGVVGNRGAGLVNNLGVGLTEDIQDYLTVKKSPVPVTIMVGNIRTADGKTKPIFTHHDMVITDVNFELSQEVTSRGPLRINVSLHAQSRKLVNGIDNTGLSDNFSDRIVELTASSTPPPPPKTNPTTNSDSNKGGRGTAPVKNIPIKDQATPISNGRKFGPVK